MELKRLTGPQAGVLKYDVITALSVVGLHGSPTLACSMQRLVSLITARYNWRRDEVSIGQTELATLWGVKTRTVKREVKRLIEGQWLICHRPGVRGRVAAYRLNYSGLYDQTRPIWSSIGPDFVGRMAEMSGQGKVVKVDFTPKLAPVAQATGYWAHVLALLRVEMPDHVDSWFAKLAADEPKPGMLELTAPNGFVARYIETHLWARFIGVLAKDAALKNGLLPHVTLKSPKD